MFGGSSSGTISPSGISIDGLKQIIKVSRSDKFFAAVDSASCWTLLSDEDKYCDGFTILAR